MCADIIEHTTPLTSDRGIQGLKAILITGILGGDVQPAEAARVSELVVNVTNRVGKQGEYTFGVFNLTTALTAMASLATSSRISESPKYMNAIARPDALAALFQIVADQIIVLSASFEETKEKPPGMSPADDTPEDMVSMAISTLLALSQSIFRATPGDVEADTEADTDTVKIKAELHSMILTFEKNSSAGKPYLRSSNCRRKRQKAESRTKTNPTILQQFPRLPNEHGRRPLHECDQAKRQRADADSGPSTQAVDCKAPTGRC